MILISPTSEQKLHNMQQLEVDIYCDKMHMKECMLIYSLTDLEINPLFEKH